ncbi:hypothetical protein LIER_08559 [Lithospermum erythrorhizon]|uniref:Uncharacterized protein n=1 Tax=Lithospermum erythrorhizon TaxID=34254 RepID=A0AAV3PCA3_LITER
MPSLGMLFGKVLELPVSLSVGLILLACCPGGVWLGEYKVSGGSVGRAATPSPVIAQRLISAFVVERCRSP